MVPTLTIGQASTHGLRWECGVLKYLKITSHRCIADEKLVEPNISHSNVQFPVRTEEDLRQSLSSEWSAAAHLHTSHGHPFQR